MILFNTLPFFPPDLSAGFMERLFIKLSLVHCDLIRYSLNSSRCINYHCCTSATEEAKCFSFAWAEYLFKTFLVSIGSNQNREHNSDAGNKEKNYLLLKDPVFL